mmetsp:Transcript_39922/g.120653  ORF Transcript_39922/g.120653 Transcript_39922/m.120653 type:complete len:258 (+) Transcript_39922:1554-2327(+)
MGPGAPVATGVALETQIRLQELACLVVDVVALVRGEILQVPQERHVGYDALRVLFERVVDEGGRHPVDDFVLGPDLRDPEAAQNQDAVKGEPDDVDRVLRLLELDDVLVPDGIARLGCLLQIRQCLVQFFVRLFLVCLDQCRLLLALPFLDAHLVGLDLRARLLALYLQQQRVGLFVFLAEDLIALCDLSFHGLDEMRCLGQLFEPDIDAFLLGVHIVVLSRVQLLVRIDDTQESLRRHVYVPPHSSLVVSARVTHD